MCILYTQTVHRVNLKYFQKSQHIGEVQKSFSYWEYHHQTEESGQLYALKKKIEKLI